MSYQQGYQYAQYGGSRGYAQMPQQQRSQADSQSQYQHPTVVIPSQQPRHVVANSPVPGYASQSPPLPGHPGFLQQTPPQYYTAPQPQSQQYYQAPSQLPPQQQQHISTGYSRSVLQYGQQAPYQESYQQQAYHATPTHTTLSQTNYSQQYRPSSSQGVYRVSQPRQVQPVSSQSPPQPQYQSAPRLPAQAQSPIPSFPNSSPDPLQGPPTLNQGHAPQLHQHKPSRNQAPQPQQRSSQQPRPATQITSVIQTQPIAQSQQQRVLTAVEIPRYTQQHSYDPAAHEMARSPKRRRSNDGHAVAVCDVSAKSKSSQQLSKEVPISSSPLTELNSSQFQPTPKPSVDYQAVLLSLGDEYVASAYTMSLSIAAGNATGDQHNMYCALMSSAMACFESVLNNYRRIDPRKEARIRLRLASLMIDECENDEEVEAIIGKGIALCERSRLPDLKYAMHHVSVRLTFRQHPKAALKSLDKLVQEVDALHLQHWMYTFRFLRVCLGLEYGVSSEVPATLKHLQALNHVAENERHISAQIVAATLSAIVNLRSSAPDALDTTLRAMATARTHQLGSEMQAMPQIRGLLDCLDVAYGLMSFNVEHAHAMMLRMHRNFDNQSRDLGWSKYGSFTVELGVCGSNALEQDTGGILRNAANGNAVLVMRWLTHSQLYALSYLLTGITMMTKSSGDVNVEKSFRDGMKLAKLVPDVSKRSLSAMTTLLQQQQIFSSLMRIFSIVSLCGRFEWTVARQAIKEAKKDFKHAQLDTSSDINRLMLYLEALCRQGEGDLKGALMLYGSPDLTFAAESKSSGTEKDLRALATLNRVYIMRRPGLEGLANADDLFASIEQHCFQHPSKAIYCAANLAKAMSQSTIINTKQYLQRAVSASKEAANNLLQCIGMNIMTNRFFSTAIVGDQAEKSAHAGRTLAKQGKNKLWTAVADGMYADIKERCGKLGEANAASMEGMGAFKELPPSLQEGLVENLAMNGAARSN